MGIVRIYGLTVQNRAGAIALGIAALMVGGVFLIFGLALLVAVAVVGMTLGAGVILYRRLTGRGALLADTMPPSTRLDPAKEVFPADASPQRIDAVSSQHDASTGQGESTR